MLRTFVQGRSFTTLAYHIDIPWMNDLHFHSIDLF